MPISDDTASHALQRAGLYLTDMMTPTLRLGVTGLSRAGTTIFITALIRNLVSGGRLPFFMPEAEGRIERAYQVRAHRLDPLGALELEDGSYARMTAGVVAVARAAGAPPPVVLLEGGYARMLSGASDNPNAAAFGDYVMQSATKAGDIARSTPLRTR